MHALYTYVLTEEWMDVIALKYNESRVFLFRSSEAKHKDGLIPTNICDRHWNWNHELSHEGAAVPFHKLNQINRGCRAYYSAPLNPRVQRLFCPDAKVCVRCVSNKVGWTVSKSTLRQSTYSNTRRKCIYYQCQYTYILIVSQSTVSKYHYTHVFVRVRFAPINTDASPKMDVITPVSWTFHSNRKMHRVYKFAGKGMHKN